MAHVKLKSISLRAFRSFVEETTVQLPESGMLLVRGANKDSKGSSGSGKSSFNLAIAYAFNHSPFPATALQSWHTETPMNVEVTFDTPEGEAVLSRGQKLSLAIGDTKIKGSAKAVEEKLQALTGLKPELLAALTYRAQRKPGLFLSKTDAEKKEFLTTLLGLEKYEAEIERTQERIKALEAQFAAQQIVLASKERDHAQACQRAAETPLDLEDESVPLRAAEEMKLRIEVFERERKANEDKYTQQHLQGLSKAEAARDAYLIEIGEIQKQIAGLRMEVSFDTSEANRIEALLNEARRRLTAAREEDAKARSLHEAQGREIETKIREAKRIYSEKATIQTTVRKLVGRMEALNQNVCPTCMRQWHEHEEEKASVAKELEAASAALQHCNDQTSVIEALEAELKALPAYVANPNLEKLAAIEQKLVEDLAAEKQKFLNVRNQAKLSYERDKATLEAKLQSVKLEEERAYRAEVEALEASLEPLSKEMQRASEEISSAKLRLNQFQTEHSLIRYRNTQKVHSHEQAVKAQENAASELEGCKTQMAALEWELAAEQDFLVLIGREGFLGAIFDEVLFEISEETNQILAGVPNTAHVSLTFQSETTTQKGTVRKTITPIVSIAGTVAPLYSGCSGGMISAIELAVDLAVIAVVSSRTGVVPGWLVLDEAFEGLGTVEKEGCLEILQKYAQDRLVIVVDHASEFKEMFEQIIDVEYQDGQSVIR